MTILLDYEIISARSWSGKTYHGGHGPVLAKSSLVWSGPRRGLQKFIQSWCWCHGFRPLVYRTIP